MAYSIIFYIQFLLQVQFISYKYTVLCIVLKTVLVLKQKNKVLERGPIK